MLITDFWSAYESVCAEDRRYCLVHLLRELEKVDLKNDSAEWQAFAKKLRCLVRDGIRLRKQDAFAPDKYRSRIDRLNQRLAKLAAEEHVDGDARRLTKRLRKYAEYLFTFLDYTDVPFDDTSEDEPDRPNFTHDFCTCSSQASFTSKPYFSLSSFDGGSVSSHMPSSAADGLENTDDAKHIAARIINFFCIVHATPSDYFPLHSLKNFSAPLAMSCVGSDRIQDRATTDLSIGSPDHKRADRKTTSPDAAARSAPVPGEPTLVMVIVRSYDTDGRDLEIDTHDSGDEFHQQPCTNLSGDARV